MRSLTTVAIAFIIGGTTVSANLFAVLNQISGPPHYGSPASHHQFGNCPGDGVGSEFLNALCELIEKLGCECKCKSDPTSSVPGGPSSTGTTSTDSMTSTSTKSTSATQSSSTQSTTTTTTTTTTATTSRPPCATPTCTNTGARFARYDNPFRHDYSSDYDSFDLDYFKDKTPLETGTTNTIYLKTDAANETFNHAALEFRTFLYACQSGTYTFTSSAADDATLMWFGKEKVDNPTRKNTDIAQFWYGDNEPKTVQIQIEANSYYPILILWGNTEGKGFLNLQIYAPDGRELTSSSGTTGESFLLVEPCKPAEKPGPPPTCHVRGCGQDYIETLSGVALGNCRDACLNRPDCLSYSGAWLFPRGWCYLYGKPVSQVSNLPWGLPSNPNNYMYDRDCPKPFADQNCRVRKLGFYHYRLVKNTKTAACKAECDKDPICKSYCAADSGPNLGCYLYKRPVAYEPFGGTTEHFPAQFMYDRDCDLNKKAQAAIEMPAEL